MNSEISVTKDRQESKADTAYRLLRRDIVSTRLAPGSPLRINALSANYAVGLTPLREALSRLEAEGLVVAINNRGFCAAPVSRAELEDLTNARRAIEIPMLLHAIAHGDDSWEDGLVTAHYRLSRCQNALDATDETALDHWDEKHDAFHTALLGGGGSKWLQKFRATLSDQLRRHHRYLSLQPLLHEIDTGAPAQGKALQALTEARSLDAHTALMEAALNRDAERAKTLMNEHIDHTLNVFSHIKTEKGAP